MITMSRITKSRDGATWTGSATIDGRETSLSARHAGDVLTITVGDDTYPIAMRGTPKARQIDAVLTGAVRAAAMGLTGIPARAAA